MTRMFIKLGSPGHCTSHCIVLHSLPHILIMFLPVLLFSCVISSVNSQLFGERRPFSPAHKREIISEANDIRSTRSRSDLHCLSWNDKLAEQAQAWAIQCQTNKKLLIPHPRDIHNDDLCYMNGLRAMIFTSPKDPAVRDILLDWAIRGQVAYNYAANTCKSNAKFHCHNYKQLMHAGIHEIGCAKAECRTLTGSEANGTSGFVAICAVPAAGIREDRPYLEGTQCAQCLPNVSPAQNLTCQQLQAGKLCCPTKPLRNQCTNKCLGKFERFFSKQKGNHFYTASPQEKSDVLSKGYRFEKITGAIMMVKDNERECERMCPEKVALHRMWSDSKKDHMYTTNNVTMTKKGTLLQGGYKSDTIAGYVVLRRGDCGANVGVYEYEAQGLFNADHFYATAAREVRGYKRKGIAFYLWKH